MKYLRKILAWMLSLAVVLPLLQIPVFAAETFKPKEFRAVWVSTIYHLDYPSEPTQDPVVLIRDANKILDQCVELGMNAVVLQVRPSGDAFYDSDIYPWSQHLTGAQGIAPKGNFDPLAYWVEEAHRRGIELHAWINPYRVTRSKDADFNALASTNPALLHPDWVVKHSDGNYYLDPGIPGVQDLVIKGASEIARKYDVDGIHMDDYFYPGKTFDDADTYKQYGSDFKNIEDWRRHNIDELIRKLDITLHRIDRNLSFGISPFGIWANSSSLPEGSDTAGNETYYSHYADTYKWVKEGWIDYICPQIYWEIGHKSADYETLAHWWADTVKGTGVKLYVGMADYKAGNSSETSPWHGIDQIKKQIELNAAIPEITGEVHFRHQFMQTVPGLAEYYKTQYAGKPVKPDPKPDPKPEPKPEPVKEVSRNSSRDKRGEWVRYSDSSWKFEVSKKPVINWYKIDGSWYYFDKNGIMQTGWVEMNNSRYYLQPWGGMKTGWLKLNDTWYYLYSWGGLAVSCRTPDGYQVDASGALI